MFLAFVFGFFKKKKKGKKICGVLVLVLQFVGLKFYTQCDGSVSLPWVSLMLLYCLFEFRTGQGIERDTTGSWSSMMLEMRPRKSEGREWVDGDVGGRQWSAVSWWG